MAYAIIYLEQKPAYQTYENAISVAFFFVYGDTQ